jgi:flagellar biosynthesis protein FliQ
MQPDIALRMTSDLFWTAFVVCLPILAITMIVGLTVSILQVVTQVQEMTLTFVPKLLAAGITMFAIHLWIGIPNL